MKVIECVRCHKEVAVVYCGECVRGAVHEKFVETIAKLLYFKAGGDGWEKEPDKPKHYLDLGKETFRKTAREILSLLASRKELE